MLTFIVASVAVINWVSCEVIFSILKRALAQNFLSEQLTLLEKNITRIFCHVMLNDIVIKLYWPPC